MSLKRKRSFPSAFPTSSPTSLTQSSIHASPSFPTPPSISTTAFAPFNYSVTKPSAANHIVNDTEDKQYESVRTRKRWRNNRPNREEVIHRKTLGMLYDGAKRSVSPLRVCEAPEEEMCMDIERHDGDLNVEEPSVQLGAAERHQASLHRFWGGGGGNGRGMAQQKRGEDTDATMLQEQTLRGDCITALGALKAERHGGVEAYFRLAESQRQKPGAYCGAIASEDLWARDVEGGDIIMV